MKIKIQKVIDKEDLDKERIVFNVEEDDFLGSYLVFKSKKMGEQNISSRIDEIYWFPDKEVKKGDLIVLYSKGGTDTEKKNEDGTMTYFYYWYKGSPLWDSSETVIVLSQLQNWDFKTIE